MAAVRSAGGVRELRAADLALRPDVLAASATVGEARAALAGGHKHLALVVDDSGTLLTTLDHADLARASVLPPSTAASTLGTLVGRTVPADLPHADVTAALVARGSRRLAVVDDAGRLVGLVCLKRSGRGFCTDADVSDRRSDPQRR